MNEITGRTKSSTSVGTIAYDAAGQMTQNDRYRYVYDGFGRLVALKDGPTGDPIATYGYNGLGFRIWEQPDGGDKRFFCYDERWRIVATFQGTSATPTRRVIHHAAGAAGMGGSSYIDSVILEDANDDTADVNLETRYYPLQNWRADVVCVGKLNGSGFQLVEVVDYDTYGNALSRPAVSADFNRDGGLDGSDFSAFNADYELGEPSADTNLDGGIDGSDLSTFFAAYEAGIYGPSRGACAYSGVIAGYAGYVRDRFALNGDLYQVRHRVYDTKMGTWTKRDPLGYVDGMGLYEYCASKPILSTDPTGYYAQQGWVMLGACALGGVIGGIAEYSQCVAVGGSNCGCEGRCAAAAGCMMGACMGYFIGSGMGAGSAAMAGCACAAISVLAQLTCSVAICGSNPDVMCAAINAAITILMGCISGGMAGPLKVAEIADKFMWEVLGVVYSRIFTLCESFKLNFLTPGKPRGGPAPAGPGARPDGTVRVRDQYSAAACNGLNWRPAA